MSEGVIGATVESGKRHPMLVVGGCVALVVVFFVLSRGKASPSAQPFNFSYGPSDAQVTAGAAAQVATTQANAATTIAATQATAQTAQYGSYFDYLTSAGQTNAAASTAQAQIASNTANYAVNANDTAAVAISNNQTTVAGIAAGVQNNAISANYQTAVAGYNAQQYAAAQTVNVTSINAAAADYQANLAAGVAVAGYNSANTVAGYSSLTAQTQAAYQSLTAQHQSDNILNSTNYQTYEQGVPKATYG